MFRVKGSPLTAVVICLVSLTCLTARAVAEPALTVYGPSGPSPAIRDAAAAFGALHNVEVAVHTGSIENWIDVAGGQADLIYASAAFMMARFERDQALQIDRDSVTPLYMRPSVILVRPGNPLGIYDLPHLLSPGVRVMVVSGSGQTGLWEDVVGRKGDIRMLRDLRRNIVYYAETSDEAMRAWKTRDDIDAWITWNIWYVPLRHQATLIPVSSDFTIYRHCSIALTRKGLEKPLAREFIRFLMSPEGSEIFGSWGWMTKPPEQSPLTVRHDIWAVCRIEQDTAVNGVSESLTKLRDVLRQYEAVGVPAGEVHLRAVIHGEAAACVLTDEARAGREAGPNPNKALVQELLDLGVQIEVCGKTLGEQGLERKDVLPGVEVVPGAYARVLDLQGQGYAWLPL